MIAILIAFAPPLVCGAWWLWWRWPKREVNRLALKTRDPKARADVEDNFRKTAGQLMGGAAVLIGAGFALFQFLQQQQAAHDKPVLEALCAFVREKTIRKIPSKDKPATDVQAALTVIGRRIEGPGVVDLANISIPETDLRGADLNGANLSGAYLIGINLLGANLIGADLRRANLSYAKLRGDNLIGADLSGVNLSRADLGGANLSGANLSRANLSGTDLRDANLSGANLRGAYLSGARELTQTQLDEACGDANTKLPEGLKPPKPCPVPPPHVP
jgi:uncharacterized protein YjbI with pentapeptide repeats